MPRRAGPEVRLRREMMVVVLAVIAAPAMAQRPARPLPVLQGPPRTAQPDTGRAKASVSAVRGAS